MPTSKVRKKAKQKINREREQLRNRTNTCAAACCTGPDPKSAARQPSQRP